MFKILLIAAVLPAIILGITVVPCENGRPPLAIHIPGCAEAPCIAEQAGSIDYQFEWIASADSSSLSLELLATVLGQTSQIDLPAEKVNLCESLDVGSCPTTVGQALVVDASLDITLTHDFDVLPVTFEYRVLYDNGDISACALVDVELY